MTKKLVAIARHGADAVDHNALAGGDMRKISAERLIAKKAGYRNSETFRNSIQSLN